MAQYIQGRDGRFAGSIGDGKTATPTSQYIPAGIPSPYVTLNLDVQPDPLNALLDNPAYTLSNVGLAALAKPRGKTREFFFGTYKCNATYDKRTGNLTVIFTGTETFDRYGTPATAHLKTNMPLFTEKIAAGLRMDRQELANAACEAMRQQDITDRLKDLAKAMADNGQLQPATRRRLFGIF
jgi:hypothetical protein